jgi:dihydrofolate reductase
MSITDSKMPPLKLTLIVAATSKNLGIGKNGGLPWRLKSEMQYFARVTTRLPEQYASLPKGKVQNAVIMGRKTWESIPKKFRPLKERLNVVLSRSRVDVEGANMVDGALWVKSLEEAVSTLEALQESDEPKSGDGVVLPRVARAFIIGGAGVYRSALELPYGIADRVLLTKVHSDFECDTFFPVDLDGEDGAKLGWRRSNNQDLSAYVGEEVGEGSIKEGETEFEYCLFERRSDET